MSFFCCIFASGFENGQVYAKMDGSFGDDANDAHGAGSAGKGHDLGQ